MSRVSFAMIAGLDSSQLRRYEECVAPVRYDHAKLICAAFKISLRWLAIGGEQSGHWEIDDSSFSKDLSARALFSAAWDDHLRVLSEAKADNSRAEMASLMTSLKDLTETIKATRKAGIPPPPELNEAREQWIESAERLLAQMKDYQKHRRRLSGAAGQASSGVRRTSKAGQVGGTKKATRKKTS